MRTGKYQFIETTGFTPAFLSIDTFLIGLKRAMVIGNSVKQGILCRSFRMPLQAERSVAKANHR